MNKMYTDNRGRKRKIGNYGHKGTPRAVSRTELNEMAGVGIRHPGSLTKYGYRINNSLAKNKIALNKAISKYGRKEVLRKLADLYRLDYNKPKLKTKIVEQIRYVSGGKRND